MADGSNGIERFVSDEQTGKVFRLKPEEGPDTAAARFSIVYLIAMLLFLSWELFDIWSGRFVLLRGLLSEEAGYLDSTAFRLIAYTVIGGGLGAIVNGMRSILVWHSERHAFGRLYIWKYITLPLLGGVLAAIVYAIIGGGIAALGGDFTVDGASPNRAMVAFAIGALSGYGSQKVFKWLDSHVNRVFKIEQSGHAIVPSLEGKTAEQADDALAARKLKVGAIHEEAGAGGKVGKVVRQRPAANSVVPEGGAVEITVGVKGRAGKRR